MVIYSVFDIFTIFYEAKLQITILPSKSSAEKHHSPAIYSLPRTYEEPILWMFLRFTTDWTDRTDSVLWGKEEIKKFVAFPVLTPLQPDVYAQPCKRASLSEPPHPSGLPNGRRESIKTK